MQPKLKLSYPSPPWEPGLYGCIYMSPYGNVAMALCYSTSRRKHSTVTGGYCTMHTEYG